MLALCLGFVAANAQITTGESTSQVIRTGNRAKAGNFGIYFGATTEMFKNIANGGPQHFEALPLINLKYMQTDNLEFRLGFEWYKKSDTNKDEFEGGESKATEKESSFMFYPGLAYHFNNRNLLDVYVGGDLPFGFGSKGSKSELSREGEDSDDELTAKEFKIGLGAFIGLQAYIANLPLAIGMEYGVNCLYHHVGDGTLTQDGMTIDAPMEDHTNNQFKLGHQVRFTLSYYFNL